MSEQLTWQDTEVLNERFLEAAEGNEASKQVVADALETAVEKFPAWSPTIRKAWLSGLELMFLDGVDRKNLKPVDIKLILISAKSGVDFPLLRDLLAIVARNTFSEYLDPAGVLAAINIQNPSVSIFEVMKRWDFFSSISEGLYCFLAGHGKGIISEFDTLGNDIYVKTDRVRPISLVAFMEEAVLVKPESAVEKLTSKYESWKSISSSGELQQEMDTSLLGNPDLWDEALQALLGGIVPAEALRSILGHDLEDADRDSESVQREWGASRSVVELVDILQNATDVSLDDESMENLRNVWNVAAPKDNQQPEFVDSVALLWRHLQEEENFVEFVREIRPKALCWNDKELFLQLSDKMAGRYTTHWFGASLEAMGIEQLCDVAVELPLRLWSVVEKVLKRVDNGVEYLIESVKKAVDEERVLPDAIVWLWKTKRPERIMMANSTLVFRTLVKPASGSYLKARSELNRMMMDSQEFQRFLMHNGQQEAIASLVSCVRHMPGLEKGEQQSLLVKIVRLYPSAKSLVEKRSKVIKRKELPKITSVHSYEVRRQELQDIINSKIPENSRAIAHARSYGDLRENAEYKAAKEEQLFLGARRSELEEALHEIQQTDFRDVEVDTTVIPGSTAILKIEDGSERQYHILGMWDSEPEKFKISFETPIGRLLIGKQVGDEFELPSGQNATLKEIKALSEDILEWCAGSLQD